VKAQIVRRHLAGKEPVSKLAEEFGVQPSQVHGWVNLVLDQAEKAFEHSAGNVRSEQAALTAMEHRIEFLEAKLVHKNERIAVLFDAQLTASANVQRILDAARVVGKLSSVAQYPVGAKLQLRFPHLNVANELASSADDSTGRAGDFEVGDTVFHITVSPGVAVVAKCQQNLSHGRQAYLLVPDSAVLAAREHVEYACAGRVTVTSIEGFVSANLDELSEFRRAEFVSGFRRLLELYNDRVDQIETDKSLLFEIPPNLK
jgi:transposase-like protein